jgi:hypothetical protein
MQANQNSMIVVTETREHAHHGSQVDKGYCVQRKEAIGILQQASGESKLNDKAIIYEGQNCDCCN